MGFCPWMLHVFCDLCQLVTTAGIGHAHEASRRNLFPVQLVSLRHCIAGEKSNRTATGDVARRHFLVSRADVDELHDLMTSALRVSVSSTRQ